MNGPDYLLIGKTHWVSLIAGLDSPLEHGTGLFDWNVGLYCWTGILSTTTNRHVMVLPHNGICFLKLLDKIPRGGGGGGGGGGMINACG